LENGYKTDYFFCAIMHLHIGCWWPKKYQAKSIVTVLKHLPHSLDLITTQPSPISVTKKRSEKDNEVNAKVTRALTEV
jgi:hypothetical protein